MSFWCRQNVIYYLISIAISNSENQSRFLYLPRDNENFRSSTNDIPICSDKNFFMGSLHSEASLKKEKLS